MGNDMNNEASPSRRFEYTWHCSKKSERLQPFSSVVVMNTIEMMTAPASTVRERVWHWFAPHILWL